MQTIRPTILYMNTMIPCFYRVSAKALILNERLEFALCKEENNMYDLPGGGIEHGEEVADNIKREILEETGLQVNFIENTPRYFITSFGKRKTPLANIIYRISVENYSITPSKECIALEFHTVDSASMLPIYDNVRAFIELYNPKHFL